MAYQTNLDYRKLEYVGSNFSRGERVLLFQERLDHHSIGAMILPNHRKTIPVTESRFNEQLEELAEEVYRGMEAHPIQPIINNIGEDKLTKLRAQYAHMQKVKGTFEQELKPVDFNKKWKHQNL